MGHKLRHPTVWKDSHFDAGGLLISASGLTARQNKELRLSAATIEEVLALQPWLDNNVTDEGEAWVLEASFHDDPGAAFTGFEVVLATTASITESTAFAGITEKADADGYAAKAVARAQSAGNWSTTSGTTPTLLSTPDTGTHSWTASAAWAAVEYACVVTLATTQILVAYQALNAGAGRTLANGDTLNVSMDIQGGGS